MIIYTNDWKMAFTLILQKFWREGSFPLLLSLPMLSAVFPVVSIFAPRREKENQENAQIRGQYQKSVLTMVCYCCNEPIDPRTIVTFVTKVIFLYNNESVLSGLHFSNQHSIKLVFIDYMTVLLFQLSSLVLKYCEITPVLSLFSLTYFISAA